MAAPMEDTISSSDEELNSSKLGTKEYWDQAYNRELNNFADSGDVGEVWFGEDSVDRVIKWMDKNNLVTTNSSVLDLGCGNGIMLIELYKQGYKDLCGVDYVQAAVDLAQAIATKEECTITYERGDILEDPITASCLKIPYDICIDKGTYDAISLCPDEPAEKRAAYISNVVKLLKDQGLLIITSCNWTQDELLKQFSKEFSFLAKIPTPTFQFGGMSGSREAAVVFKKNAIS